MARVLGAISRLFNALGSFVILPLLTLLITADVILRYVFNAPLSWGLEASRYFLLLFFLFGLLESFRAGDHIAMEFFAPRMTRTVRRIVSILQALLLVLIFGLITKKAIEDIPFLYSLPELTPELGLPVWMFYAFIAFVAVLVISYVVSAVVAILRGDRDTVEEVARESWGE